MATATLATATYRATARALRSVFAALASAATTRADERNLFFFAPARVEARDFQYPGGDHNFRLAALYSLAVPMIGGAVGDALAVLKRAAFRALREGLKGLKPSQPVEVQIEAARAVTFRHPDGHALATVPADGGGAEGGAEWIVDLFRGDPVDWPGKVPAVELLDALTAAHPARSTEDSRPVLNRFAFDMDRNARALVLATDGHVLVSRPIGQPSEVDRRRVVFDGRWIVLRKILTAAAKRGETSTVQTGTGGGVRIEGDGYRLELPSEGHYPDVRQVEPREHHVTAEYEFGADALAGALGFCRTVPTKHYVRASFDGDSLKLARLDGFSEVDGADFAVPIACRSAKHPGPMLAKFSPRILEAGLGAVEANGLPVVVRGQSSGVAPERGFGRIDAYDARGSWTAIMARGDV